MVPSGIASINRLDQRQTSLARQMLYRKPCLEPLIAESRRTPKQGVLMSSLNGHFREDRPRDKRRENESATVVTILNHNNGEEWL